MGLYGEDIFIQEYVFKNVDDIRYNKEKFDNKEINIVYITGFSGSGKSTLGAYLNKETDIEHVDMDLIVFQKSSLKTEEDMKNNGNMCYDFFTKGEGKKYRSRETNPYAGDFKKYTEAIVKEFFNYSKQYAATHKKTRFVVEGVWLYRYIKPEQLKDYAVYIKGTSATESSKRAVLRDYNLRRSTGMKTQDNMKMALTKIKNDIINMKTAEKYVGQYIKYFNKL